MLTPDDELAPDEPDASALNTDDVGESRGCELALAVEVEVVDGLWLAMAREEDFERLAADFGPKKAASSSSELQCLAMRWCECCV